MTTEEKNIQLISDMLAAEQENLDLPFEQAILKLCPIAYKNRIWEVMNKGPQWTLQSAAETEVFLLLEINRLRKLLKEEQCQSTHTS